MRLTGFVYRAHNPRWAFAPDSGLGAAATGGRFNPIGMAALYTGRRFETAWLEAQQAFPFKAQPMTLCAYELDCEDILDLTDAGTLAAQGIAAGDLACPWKDLSTRGIKPPTWLLAERLVARGTAGIVVPSFAKGAGAADMNVVFWDWAPEPPHQVRVIDDDRRLPKDDSSWRRFSRAHGPGSPPPEPSAGATTRMSLTHGCPAAEDEGVVNPAAPAPTQVTSPEATLG